MKDKPTFVELCEKYPKLKRMKDRIIYMTIWGSRCYGLADEDSDMDIRGIYIEPLNYTMLATAHKEKDFVDPTEDIIVANFSQYFKMAVYNSPYQFEPLFTAEENIIYQTDLSRKLRAQAHKFISLEGISSQYETYINHAVKTFRSAYALNPTDKKAWKRASHAIRGCMTAIDAMNGKGIILQRTESDLNLLRRIRNGGMTKEGIDMLIKEYKNRFQEAKKTSSIPKHPNKLLANQISLMIYSRWFLTAKQKAYVAGLDFCFD